LTEELTDSQAASRRRFLRLALSGAMTTLLAACAPAAQPAPATSAPPATAKPTSAPSGAAGAASPAALASPSVSASPAATTSGAAAAQTAPARFPGRQLTSSGFGGNTQDVIQKVIFDPFNQASGAQSTQVSMQSAEALARMRAEKGNPQIDLYQFSGGQETVAASEALSEVLANIPAAQDLSTIFKDPNNQWVAIAVIAEGIVYNTEKINPPPTSYKDFLNPAYQGHIAFPDITNGYGLDFLVMMARAFGGGEGNIEPGFQQVEKIAPQATIFKAAAEMPTLFGQGDIWMMPYDTGNAFHTHESGLPVAFVTPQEGSPAVFITTVIAKGTKNADVAQALINFALQPDVQANLATGIRWAPVNPRAQLPPDVARDVPSGEEGLKKLVLLDRVTLNANRPAWTERWNREVAK
jgi:putative spermidine/putrescine transport system substrate-binding protein